MPCRSTAGRAGRGRSPALLTSPVCRDAQPRALSPRAWPGSERARGVRAQRARPRPRASRQRRRARSRRGGAVLVGVAERAAGRARTWSTTGSRRGGLAGGRHARPAHPRAWVRSADGVRRGAVAARAGCGHGRRRRGGAAAAVVRSSGGLGASSSGGTVIARQVVGRAPDRPRCFDRGQSQFGASTVRVLPSAERARWGVSESPARPAGGLGGGRGGGPVHVVGHVRAGESLAPQGSRVAARRQAAGGATSKADLYRLDLARVLVDGGRFRYPLAATRSTRPDRGDGRFGRCGRAGGASGAKVSLDTADLTALDTPAGVGRVLAQRILDWRSATGGPPASTSSARSAGYGEKVLAQLSPLVTL